MKSLNRKILPGNAIDSTIPVKVIQFGTGVLLRGLIDVIFQEAKNKGKFSGCIAMVKSTSTDVSEFIAQNNLYTVIEAGIDSFGNKTIESKLINCIHHTWSAQNDWDKIGACFKSSDLDVIISNVTEIGLSYDDKAFLENIPSSYPAKLVSLLKIRFDYFNGDIDKGLIIIPTELIVDNGNLLKEIVIKHAQELGYSSSFIDWIITACSFCDSLVDRIVPGSIKGTTLANEVILEYEDQLAIQTEPYRLWAIQGDERVKKWFHFSNAIEGLIVADTIESFREQKLRLLNGGHTLAVPIAFAVGCNTVQEMMLNKPIEVYIKYVCENEILPTLKSIAPTAPSFYNEMLNRWRNPYIQHKLISILGQTTSKIQSRYADTILRYIKANENPPMAISFAFACYLYLFRPHKKEGEKYYAHRAEHGIFEIQDQKASFLYQHWQTFFSKNETNELTIVQNILDDQRIFNHNFTQNLQFVQTVKKYFTEIATNGILKTLERLKL